MSDEPKLSLVDAVGMAVGGMVGGGIFAVLGTAAHRAGNAAFLSFGLAGILALLTGISYVRLTCSFDEAGGSFSYIEHIVGPRLAGSVSWFLILGYLFTISLYAYTFGAYLSSLLGIESGWGAYLGGAIVVALTGLNLVGVRESGLVEDILVFGKILVLLALTAVGLFIVEPDQSLPVLETGPLSVMTTATLIFVGFEGFQLLMYDYDDIEDHGRNLPRAVIGSILLVTGLYMLIAFVTTGTVSDAQILEHKETVLAIVARPIFGRFGFVIVTAAAVISTASAINATIFATARLGKRVGRDCQLPRRLVDKTIGGMPVNFVALMSVLAIVVQFAGNLHQITGFSSMVFLFVFGAVNLAAIYHGEFGGVGLLVPLVGMVGCWLSLVGLGINFYRNEPGVFLIMAGIGGVLILARLMFSVLNKRFLNRHCEVNLKED